jgi:hypothetical protein
MYINNTEKSFFFVLLTVSWIKEYENKRGRKKTKEKKIFHYFYSKSLIFFFFFFLIDPLRSNYKNGNTNKMQTCLLSFLTIKSYFK